MNLSTVAANQIDTTQRRQFTNFTVITMLLKNVTFLAGKRRGNGTQS